MANGYFERGEMYDILFNDGLSGELAAHRPGIIISSDEGNRTSPTVVMIYTTTTTNKRISVNHEFIMNGWTNFALCNQIVTINKTRLKKFYGKLSDKDMRAIDDCLDIALDLGYIDDTAVKEKESEIAARDIQIKELKEEVAKLKGEIAARDIQIKELKEEVAKLKGEIAARADDDMAVKVEIAMWQRLYEKALDQVCSMKLTGDVTRRVEKAPVAPKEPVAPVVEDEPKLVDINTAKFDELKKCGLSDNIVLSIINKRPHVSVEDLKKIPGVTSVMYGIVSRKVCCVPVAPKPQPKRALVEPDAGYEPEKEPVKPSPGKVNINTASAKEIREIAGCPKQYAGYITAHRKKNGRFSSLEELENVKMLPGNFLAKYGDKLEV